MRTSDPITDPPRHTTYLCDHNYYALIRPCLCTGFLGSGGIPFRFCEEPNPITRASFTVPCGLTRHTGPGRPSLAAEPSLFAALESYVTLSCHTAPIVRVYFNDSASFTFRPTLGLLSVTKSWTIPSLSFILITKTSSLLRTNPPLCAAQVL